MGFHLFLRYIFTGQSDLNPNRVLKKIFSTQSDPSGTGGHVLSIQRESLNAWQAAVRSLCRHISRVKFCHFPIFFSDFSWCISLTKHHTKQINVFFVFLSEHSNSGSHQKNPKAYCSHRFINHSTPTHLSLNILCFTHGIFRLRCSNLKM